MSKVYIIAEAGVNHNGDINIAKQLIEKAKEAGVDGIKFQTFVADNLVSKNAEKAKYQKVNTGTEETQNEMLRKLELSFHEFVELKKYCDEINIEFISTPFDSESIEFLNAIDMPFWKVPSGEITNLPYLVQVAKTKKPIVLSTGMCNIEEIDEALKVLYKYGCPRVTLLHCNTQYPTPYEDVNLKVIPSLKERFGVDIGYSDHTLGIEVAIAAATLGATIIEKHFTINKRMEGPDHKVSLEPIELKKMVESIRNIEKSLGTVEKKPSNSECENIEIVRKSIIAKCDINTGDIFTEENITTKRPGNGISPMNWFEVLGQAAIKDFRADEKIII